MNVLSYNTVFAKFPPTVFPFLFLPLEITVTGNCYQFPQNNTNTVFCKHVSGSFLRAFKCFSIVHSLVYVQ